MLPLETTGTTGAKERSERRIALALLLLAALACALQIGWFWRFCAHNITSDAISYIGLARHLRDGDLTKSLHGYWSPLISWLIAAGSFVTRDLTLLGRIITVASLLSCLPLLYWLTFRLWRSHLAAAAAVLWFSIARGVVAVAVTTIQADFLFTACTIVYFSLLLTCLRKDTNLNWLLLGVSHSVAFLAKAFAMPWLFFATVLAALSYPQHSLRRKAVSLLLAFLAPVITWLSWGEMLKTKYGVFTTGYQLRANLMIDMKRNLSHHPRGDPYPLADTSYDNYMVAEQPWAAVQQFKMANPALIPVIVENERSNVPAALKEAVILLTPAGVLVLIVGIPKLIRRRRDHWPEALFAIMAVVCFASLVGAYGMLVFDARYILPIIAILIALASGFIIPGGPNRDLRLAPRLQKMCLALFVLSTVFFTIYWASPFRTIDRDFQRSCYNAVALLKQSQPAGNSLVSIGNGPYPAHGVGFEVGPYVAYLSGRHLIAMNSALPDDASEVNQLAAAAGSKKTDAVLVWGQPNNHAYQTIVSQIESSPGATSNLPITDPAMGEVGRVITFHR